MSFTKSTTQSARKSHQCTWCYEFILPGEAYDRWASFSDGSAYTNKMHPECHKAAQDDAERSGEGGSWEYTPGEGERPAVGEFGRVK